MKQFEAGWDLDLLITRHVLGQAEAEQPAGHYSMKEEDAGFLIDFMAQRYGLRPGEDDKFMLLPVVDGWYCRFPRPNYGDGRATTRPVAVCLAALDAVGYQRTNLTVAQALDEPLAGEFDNLRGWLYGLLYALLREQSGFNSKRPFGESDWYSYLTDGLKRMDERAESHGSGGNEVYLATAEQVLDYLFEKRPVGWLVVQWQDEERLVPLLGDGEAAEDAAVSAYMRDVYKRLGRVAHPEDIKSWTLVALEVKDVQQRRL